jgi:phenylpropionate dioxygenase-like ring-hydroxylating dioxygenase large terminal subunit
VNRERESALHAPVSALPPVPTGWFFFCTECELLQGPVACDFLNRKLVAFRTRSGSVGILDARCQHLGADLAQGRVVDACLECPFHNWQYATDGQCTRIPQSNTIPEFARQKSYPVEVRHGLVFMWNGNRPLYPLPFYEGADPEAFVCSTPAIIELNCPWYLVGANSFDSQHLYSVHERVLLQPPQIQSVGDFGLSSRTVAKVGTGTWYDRFVHSFSGPVATMTATNWSGSLVFVRVDMQRTTTFGMVSLRPLGKERVLVHIFAFLPRSHSAIFARVWDPMRTELRLYFIQQFLKDDVERLEGVRAGTLNLIGADLELARYFQWLASSANGIPAVTDQNVNSNFYEGARA